MGPGALVIHGNQAKNRVGNDRVELSVHKATGLQPAVPPWNLLPWLLILNYNHQSTTCNL